MLHLLTATAGAGLGLLLFLGESWLIARLNVAGFDVQDSGAFGRLFAAVRPQLPQLLARIVLAYVLAGAALGWVSGLLAQVMRPARFWRVWFCEWWVLCALWFWNSASARPALVDDLLPESGLRLLLDFGEPWHALLAAALVVGGHVLIELRREGARRFVPVLGLLACLVFPASTRSGPDASPLIVLLGVDAFRPDRLGRGIAPNLEAFAQQATVFEQAYTPIAQTQPAWRSLLTARWPWRTGLRYALTPEKRWEGAPTFTDVLAHHGFQTSFSTDCSRFNHQPANSGFVDRHQPPQGAINFLLEKLRYRALGAFADNEWGRRLLPEFMDNRALAGIHDPMLYARGLAHRWAEQTGPALLAFHATAAHFPGDPIHPFYRRFVSSDEPPHRRTRMHFGRVEPGARGGWSREGSEALYDQLLAQADAQAGILLESLKQSGRYDEALIVAFSDHGESFHEDRPDLAGATPVHGARLSEAENRILLAIKWPRSREIPPSVVNELVRLIDIGPTILEVAGVGALPDADGASLLGLARGQQEAPRRLFAETAFTHVRPDVFVPGHKADAPRTLEAYVVQENGVIEMGDAAHDAILGEKDLAAFDGKGWWVRTPMADGTMKEQCRGECSESLVSWFNQQAPRTRVSQVEKP